MQRTDTHTQTHTYFSTLVCTPNHHWPMPNHCNFSCTQY
uniref:Uncharacterized protein n=1 Tax=Anguilla anguilla TaxID=7936 RepID=A0A0E9XVN4_ANGAN